jgi:zinc protease
VELDRILRDPAAGPATAALSISADGARALTSRSIRPRLVALGIGGNVTKEAVGSALGELTSGWNVSGEPSRRTSPPSATASISFHTIEADTLEGWVAIGRMIGDVPPPERGALAVLAQILGTRLNIATREIRGLTNRAIFTLPDSATGGGLLYVSTGGRSEAVAPLVKFCRDELSRLHRADEPIREDEFARAKGALVLGQWQAALDGPRQASGTYAIETVRRGSLDEFLNWPAAVNAVTAQQVKSAASKYLGPDEMVTVVVGPIEQIRQARHPRWPVALNELGPPSHAGK